MGRFFPRPSAIRKKDDLLAASILRSRSRPKLPWACHGVSLTNHAQQAMIRFVSSNGMLQLWSLPVTSSNWIFPMPDVSLQLPALLSVLCGRPWVPDAEKQCQRQWWAVAGRNLGYFLVQKKRACACRSLTDIMMRFPRFLEATSLGLATLALRAFGGNVKATLKWDLS